MQLSDATARHRARRLDRDDPLAPFLERFIPLESGVVYLDGNSLGRPPRSTLARLTEAIQDDWAGALIRSWSHWADLPQRVGDELGTGLVGARPGEVVVSDSTSINLYKLAVSAIDARPGRPVMVIEEDNFPSDRYVLEGIAARQGLELRVVPTHMDHGLSLVRLAAALDDRVSLVCLSHVSYRSGALADLAAITGLVHEAGGLILWDLCHSVGSVPIDLTAAGADLAAGCTYKYLNAGPGAPAFLYVRRELQDQLGQPIWGWFGQSDQFTMAAEYEPRPGIARFQVGTPSILGIYAVQEGVRLLVEAGMPALRNKGMALTSYAVELFDAWLAPLGFELASPRDAARRGSHVTLAHTHAGRLSEELASSQVLGDYRNPDRIRLGMAALTTRFRDVYVAMARLRDLALPPG